VRSRGVSGAAEHRQDKPDDACRKQPVGGVVAPARAASVRSDLVQIAPLDEGDQFIPFGMRESDGVRVLADPDPLVGDLDLGALRAKRAKGELDRFHLYVLPAGPVQEP